MIVSDPKTLGLAFLGGIIPALIWLWFWLKEANKKTEPTGVLTIIFILGMLGVIIVLQIERFIQNQIESHSLELISWAAAEEIIKYLAVLVIIYKTNYIKKPLDWPIYMITAAVGFAAMENTLFLIKPISLGETTVSLITGQLRFLGSTLLHTISSGVLGISIGLAYFMSENKKKMHIFIGIILAVVLHSLFNFFIIKNDGNDFLKVFAFLWVATIIVMLLFEKLRRMSGEESQN